jgi:hypothetical protein
MILAFLIAAAVLTVLLIIAIVGDDPISGTYIPTVGFVIAVLIVAAAALEITGRLAA